MVSDIPLPGHGSLEPSSGARLGGGHDGMGLLARPKSMVPKEAKWVCLHMASSPMRAAKGSGAKVAGFLQKPRWSGPQLQKLALMIWNVSSLVVKEPESP